MLSLLDKKSKGNKMEFLMNDNKDDLKGKYKIQKIIGIGAFGVVFSAIDIKTNKKVAIKKVILLDTY